MSWRDQYVEDGDSQTSTVAAPEQRDWRETFVEGGSEGQAQRRAQRKAQKARERFQRDRELFNDPNAVFSGLPETSRANLEEQIQGSFDPEGAKIRLANIQYLSDVYDKDSEEVARNLGRYRQDFLLQKMEHPRPADVDDKEFYGLVGKELEAEEQKMDFTEQYLQRIQKRAVREGGTFTEAHREAMEELAEHEGFDSRALDKYMQVGMETYAEASEMFEPYREQINSLFQFIGQEEEFLLTGTMEEDLQTVLDQLERLSPEERQNVYFAVKEKAEEHDVDIGGFFKKTAEAFGRGATNIAKGHVRNLTGSKIMDAQERFSTVDKIYVPEDVPESATEDPDEYAAWLMLHAQSDSLQAVFARAGLVNYREVTPEEREIVQQKAERFEKEERIASELRNLVEREINPVEGEGGVLGTAADKIWYPFVENVPFTAEFLIPVAGIPLGVSSIVDMRREEIMQRNPEMDRRQAVQVAATGAPFEMVAELIQARMMIGKAGPLGRAFKTPATGGLSGAKRAALDLGLRTADMNIQEAVQDMTPLVFQELTSYLNDEVPGIDWEKEMGEFGKGRFDVFWATLPMVLIGTGAAKFRDAREQRAHLNDMLRLEMVGIGREKAREIVGETDFDRKNRLYEEAFAERDQGVSMDAVLRAETQQAEMAYMQDSDQATTIVARGDRNFDVEGPDGTVLGSANSFEAARALAAQKRSEEAAGTEQAVTDMMDYFEDLREDGVVLERQDVERILQEDIDEGRISEAEAYERIRIAGMNMGEDFSDMTPADVQVFGRNQKEFREKVEVDVVSIYNGADPLDVVEEHSEVHIKRAVEQGRVGWDQVQAWKDAFEDATGEVTHDNSEASLVEWFSERAKDYIVGRNKDVPPSFRSFLNQMREYVAHVMRRAATMMKLERDGKLDGDFRTELRRAVGLDRQFAEANRRERMAREDQAGFDQTTDRDPASEVQRAVKGKLPHPEVARAKGDPMAGELQDLYDAMTRRVQVTRKDGTTYTRRDTAAARAFFAKKTDPYKGTDQVREAMVTEYGFDFETSANMIDAVEASLKGREQFPTFTGQPSFSMGAERAVRPESELSKKIMRALPIQQLQDRAGVRVVVLDRQDQLPARILEEVGSNRVDGLNLGDIVVLISENLGTVEQAKRTLAHEVVGHVGMRGVLGDRFDAFMDEAATVFQSDAKMSAAVERVTRDYELDLRRTDDRRRLAEEMIAHMAEGGPVNRTILDRIVEAVRRFLRNLGFDLKMSESDILSALENARESTMGDGTPTRFDPSKIRSVRYSLDRIDRIRPGDDFQVTIQQRQGNVPGYVQVDLIRDGENVASGNLESFRAEGVDIPDVPGWVPQGRYTLDELRETIDQGPPREPGGGQEEVIGISYSLRPKGKKYPGPAVGKIDPRLPDHEMTKGDRTYVIKSLTQWDEMITRLFKSGTETLREGGFDELAKAVETNFDTRQKRLGYIQNRMENFIRDNLAPLDRKARREAYAAFREYMAARENSKVREHMADSLFEQARAKQKAEEAAALWKKMPSVSRKMVELTDRVGRETGDVNRTLVQPDGTRGIQIKDPETKKWRVIGKVKHFWPRTFKREVQQAINDTERHKVLWNQLVDALMAEGYITDRDEAKRYLNTNAPTLTENSSFAGVEQARQVQLPEIFYDYSFDAMIGYGTKWAARTSQIENFGQADYLKDKGMDGDLFDQYRKRATGTTVTYLQAARDRVYGVQVNDWWHNLMANGNILATGLMLGNPATAFGLNLPGGMGLNYQAYGIGNATKGFVDTIVNWKEHKKAAEDSGILINDLYSLMNDYENVDTKVFGLDVTEGLKTFTKLTLRYGGYLPTERFIRTHAMVTGKHFLLNAKKEWNENPDGYKARQYRKFFERNHFDIGKLRRDDPAEFERWLRYAANLTQGSYKVDQTPVWIDQPIGRVLFKYQKFQTQVTRLAWNEAFKPFAEAVANGNGRDRAAAFLPILNYFASAFVAGQVIGSVREAVFGYIRPGPDMDEVEKALEDDKRANALNLIVNRAMHNYLAAGTFGLFGNYGQMVYDIMDQQRVKNPLDPPILAAPKGMFEFVLRYAEQGKLTARDFDDVIANVFSIYRTTKRAGLRGLLLVGSELNEVEVQAAKTDIYWTRQRVRRFEQETDIGRKMTFAGRFSKNEMSPVNTKIYEAILTGDPGKASEIAREYLRTLETAEERESAKRSMRSSIRAREPVRVGQVTSAEDRRAFLKWAEEKLSAGDYERIRRTDESYRRTARRAGLM